MTPDGRGALSRRWLALRLFQPIARQPKFGLYQLARFCTRPQVLLVPRMPERSASSCTI